SRTGRYGRPPSTRACGMASFAPCGGSTSTLLRARSACRTTGITSRAELTPRAGGERARCRSSPAFAICSPSTPPSTTGAALLEGGQAGVHRSVRGQAHLRLVFDRGGPEREDDRHLHGPRFRRVCPGPLRASVAGERG